MISEREASLLVPLYILIVNICVYKNLWREGRKICHLTMKKEKRSLKSKEGEKKKRASTTTQSEVLCSTP